MVLKHAATLLLFSAALAGGVFAGVPQAAAACDAGTKIDGSTAATATKMIKIADYKDVKGLKKGCDSFWHATASKDGVVRKISLSPQGIVTVEGN
ncbi:MAG: hypothetical protein ING44_15765 [Telmatospirillum sp.]|nr:hypothetical protein [Telmatospirillum sp.]